MPKRHMIANILWRDIPDSYYNFFWLLRNAFHSSYNVGGQFSDFHVFHKKHLSTCDPEEIQRFHFAVPD